MPRPSSPAPARARPAARRPSAPLSLACALALGGTLAAGPAAASTDRDRPPTAALPEPTGPAPVGTTDLHLVDTDREDPWFGGDREIMVTLWYPARTDAGRAAPYLTGAESAAILAQAGFDHLPADTLARVRTHSVADVAPVRTDRGLPLVVISPGAGVSRTWMSSLGEDLASRGFAVAGIDHRHEANPVEFPDGLVEWCGACATEQWEEGAVNRADDVSFLLDELEGGQAWRWSELVATDRTGMVGHSWGGTATAQTLATEERVEAGLNLDGPYYPAQLEAEIDKPLALLANGQGHPWPGWEERWAGLTGWRQWIRVTDSGHSTALDRGVLMEQLGVRDTMTPTDWRRQFGDLPVEHGVDLVRSYASAYFDHHLRGGDQPILDDPGSVHPELVVVDPEGG
ncbi:acetylhydrolase [Nocardiopsis sp. B62]|uniref:alpha/beta hydrolase family protein n=1 Tax=Nocardiopsis sp. B62 TaxID=2824874 RepID=UPI001B35D97D|nr:acetylhydrolase [Nocardiopsis sp. B62]MBQ1080840.1 acetylhydrolase [Nocardiopsis sp. B62]